MNELTEYLRGFVDDTSIISDDVILEKSKDDKNIFKVKYNDKFKYVGSKYSTEKDIESFLRNFEDLSIDNLIIVFGISTGEHILELQTKMKKFNRMLIIEPDKRILKTFLNLEISKYIVQDDRISIVSYDEHLLYEFIFAFIGHESDYNNIKIAAYSNYEQLYLIEYTKFLRTLKDILRFFETNVATEIVFGKRFMNTYLHNIKYILNSYTINEFKDKFKDYTAVIVSAGPSLEKNIDMLKSIDDNVIIICGNRTLKPLIEKKITPHFMCAVDCQDVVCDMTIDYLNKEVPLLFAETTNGKLVEFQKGHKIFFKYGVVDTNIENILENKVDTLFSGGSVAHSSIDFAKYLGCSTIIFVGQDLAYTENKKHANIAEDGKYNSIDYDKNMVEVKGIDGTMIYTSKILEGYKKNLENYIKSASNSKIKFINATEGGADIEGSEVMTLKNALSKYATKKGIKNIVENSFHNLNDKNIKKIKENIKNNYRDIEEIEKNLKKARELIKKCLNSNSVKKIKKVQKLVTYINDELDNNKSVNFLSFTMIGVMVKSPVYFRYEESYNELENTKKLLKGFDKLYKDIIESIEKIKPEIENCIRNMEEAHEY